MAASAASLPIGDVLNFRCAEDQLAAVSHGEWPFSVGVIRGARPVPGTGLFGDIRIGSKQPVKAGYSRH